MNTQIKAGKTKTHVPLSSNLGTLNHEIVKATKFQYLQINGASIVRTNISLGLTLTKQQDTKQFLLSNKKLKARNLMTESVHKN